MTADATKQHTTGLTVVLLLLIRDGHAALFHSVCLYLVQVPTKGRSKQRTGKSSFGLNYVIIPRTGVARTLTGVRKKHVLRLS